MERESVILHSGTDRWLCIEKERKVVLVERGLSIGIGANLSLGSDAPKVTPSMRAAFDELKLEQLCYIPAVHDIGSLNAFPLRRWRVWLEP